MFGIGDTEFLLILIFAFLLFGPEKLPGLGKTLGKGLRQFREASDSVTKVVKTEVLNPVQDEMNKASASLETTSKQPYSKQLSSNQLTETFAQKKARMEEAYKTAEKASLDRDEGNSQAPTSNASPQLTAPQSGVETSRQLQKDASETPFAPSAMKEEGQQQ